MLDEVLDNFEVCLLSRIYLAEDVDVRWDWYGELFQFEARKTTSTKLHRRWTLEV
jgi:hypothetical protein